MPFPWQTTGALRGGVPNQMNASTPQNAEGLGVPWGKAMFNLPRYQMPGSTVNFGGGFGLSGDMAGAPSQSQTGMAPGANIGNVRFSLSRQASSDPVQNIINDIQNPLGGMSLGFTGGGGVGQGQDAPQPGLRNKMLAGSGYGSGRDFPSGFHTNTAAQSQFGPSGPPSYAANPMNLRNQILGQGIGSPTGIGGAPELGSGRAIAEGISTNTAAQYGQFGRPSPVPQYLAQQYAASPMSLRNQMLGQGIGSPLSNFYFI